MKRFAPAALAVVAALAAAGPGRADDTAAGVAVFGPQRYVRTTGAKNVYTTNVTVPAWVLSPFRLHVQNGEPDGTFRVSSASIAVNGTLAAVTADFNQNVATLDRTVALTPATVLTVTLASKPTSYLSIGLFGTNGDHTAPAVSVAAPLPGSTINVAAPALLVRYRDTAGPGEPAASGVDTSTLRVTVDGVDRTALFTRRSDEASAAWPTDAPLADGLHAVHVSVRDVAGNAGETDAAFRVDTRRPTIQVAEPPAGAFLPTRTPLLRVRYQDETALDLSALRVFLNGVDRTSRFAVGPAEAVATLDASEALPTGPNALTARVKDLGGNEAVASVSFNVDVQPPAISVVQPAAAARLGASDVELIVHYADDQALDPATFSATVDGQPVALGVGTEGASGRVTLVDGPHSVAVRVRDRAGNEGTAAVSFSVDTKVPEIHVLQPLPGALLPTGSPLVRIVYSDEQGVDLTTLRVTFDGVDRTPLFAVGPDAATATVPLPDGAVTVAAEITDLTGNRATVQAAFTIDTVAPTASFDAPPERVATGRPEVRIRWADAGTGVDPASVEVRVDGTDRTPSFAIGPDGATAVLDPALADGPHELEVRLADRAGNPARFTTAFTVDTVPPQGRFTAPLDDAFINDPAPALRLSWSDPGGTGIDPASLRLTLRAGDGPETDITADVQAGADAAEGRLPSEAPLVDGVYRLRASFADRAGNASVVEAAFELDTVAPRARIEMPAAGAHVPTGTPTIVFAFADDRTGVDTSRLGLSVDGVDRSSRLTVEAGRATATLAGALPDGVHEVAVTVFDRAGNAAPATAHSFTVDTVPPTAAIAVPTAGSLVGASAVDVRLTYGDEGPDGVDPASLHVVVDGVDVTVRFAARPDGADASVPLADGPHRVEATILDWAGNTATATVAFGVDTAPPAITLASPADGSYHRTSPVTVSGAVREADPDVRVECRRGDVVSPVTLAAAAGDMGVVLERTFTCAAGLVEGPNVVTVVATDRFGREAQAPLTLVLDTLPPRLLVTRPLDGDYTAATTIEVAGTVEDASPVTAEVEGIAAPVSAGAFQATVALGAAGEAVLHVTATDAAGNAAETDLTLHVDRTPPTIAITSPAAGAYVKGPTVEVGGSVGDGSPVLVEVNGEPAAVSAGTFAARVSAPDGPLSLQATARDAAGNAAADQRDVVVDSVPPAIAITAPLEGFVTNATTMRLTGTVSDASPVVLRVEGVSVALAEGAFATDVPVGAEGPRTIVVSATDAAGNVSTREVHGIVDRTAPVVQIASPAPGGVVPAVPVLVEGTVEDATAVVVFVDEVPAARFDRAWQASIAGLPEGPHQFVVTARDAAGNTTTVARDAIVDLAAPALTVTAPADGALTREAAIAVTGTVTDATTVTVTVAGRPATVTGSGPFAFQSAVDLVEGDTRVEVVATDAAGRPTSAAVTVTRDSTPPVVDLTVPERISKSRGGVALATATDALGVAQVRLLLGDAVLAVLAAPPFRADLAVPEGIAPGTTLLVTAEATDRAGNVAVATRSVRVVSDGALVGLVLDDRTSLPLPGARVRVRTTAGERETTTDETGRYALPATDVTASLEIDKDGMTRVVRDTLVASGTGTVPVDARLTTLADAVPLGPAGGAVTAPGLSLSIPAGRLAAPVPFRLTALSSQGLPRLLPLGWSPVAALDLRVEGASAGPLSLVASGLEDATLQLVATDSTTGWVVVTRDLVVVNGSVPVDLPGPGEYALVVADEADIAIGEAGEPLTGVPAVPLPETATTAGPVVPAQVPPSGGTAVGELAIQSLVPLTSGTVIQAEVTESYQLASTETASEEKRLEDVVLFRSPAPAGAALAAKLPITPARTFPAGDLVGGNVHLEFVSGREDVRGQTGGSEPVRLDAGDVRLVLAGGSLDEDTAIAVESVALSSFLPSATALVPLAEAVVDFSGATLHTPADLSVAFDGVTPDDTVLLARVVRLDGVPRLTVVAGAALENGRLVPRPIAGLPGVVEGGRYVWYRTLPVGIATGLTVSTAGPLSAVVTGTGLPFVAVSAASGRFGLPILAGGQVTLEAVAPHTALRGVAPATVAAGESVAVDIALAGAATTAVVTPANGALGQPVTLQLDVATDAPLAPTSVTIQNVTLLRGDPAEGASVPVRLVLAASGRRLAVVPASALAFDTTYTLQASGLVTVTGAAVIVPPTTFTTKPDTPPVYDTSALTFSFPDENGLVHVTAPAGSLPPGTQVMVLDSGNGMVLTTTARNDGSVDDDLPASINDRMLVTITDPLGNVTTFQRSQFVAPDGRVAVGPGGGVVTGDGGIEMRIPDGALDKGVVLKIEPFGPDKFPANEQPALDGGHYVGGLTITSADEPTYDKEVKLAFPVPADLPPNPEDALFFVYRRLEGPEGRVVFQAIDYAKVEGTGASAKVVTASYPFSGVLDSLGIYDLSGTTEPTTATHYYLLWRMRELFPGGPTPGVVSGKLLRPQWDSSNPNPTMTGVAGGLVSGSDDRGEPLYKQLGTNATVAVSQPDGRFTLWDPSFTGGTVNLVATAPPVAAGMVGEVRRAVAYELFGSSNSPLSPLALEIRALFGLYTHVAHANITFSSAPPPTPPSALAVHVFRDVNGTRTAAGGIVTVNTPLLIGYKGAEVTQREWKVQFGQDPPEWLATVDDPMQGTAGIGMDRITDTDYVPSVPGVYTFTAMGSTAFAGEVTASATIRVVAAGGNNTTPINGQPPAVLTFATSPRSGATGVPVSIFPQVTFSEPVKNLPGHITLSAGGSVLSCRLVGVDPSGNVIDDLSDPNTAVTSVTLQPSRALDYLTTYVLQLTGDIVDLDTAGGAPAPNALAPFDLSFTTFSPGPLETPSDLFGSAGLAIVSTDASGSEQSFAFLAQNNMYDGTLRTFDVTEPGSMVEVSPDPGADTFVWGRPADIAAAGDRVAIATNPTNQIRPSNLYVFDVTNKSKPAWVGAVSLSTSAGDGWIRRLAMDDFHVYAATFRKGIQVIDRLAAEALFSGPNRAAKIRSFNTPGEGFGWDAITQTIPVLLPDQRPARVFDLKVREYNTGDVPHPYAVAVGEPGAAFIVADTITGTARVDPAIVTAGWRVNWAEAVALGRVGNVEIAVVGGTGQIGSGPTGAMLATVGMGFPTSPMGLGAVQLTHPIGDLILRDTRAIISNPGTGTATVVDVSDPAHPTIVGTIAGVAGRMAFDDSGVLFSTERSIFGGNDTYGGLRSAAFEPHAFIRKIEPIPVIVDASVTVLPGDPEPLIPALPTALEFGLAPATSTVASASLQLYKTSIAGVTAAVGGPISVAVSASGVGTHVIPPADLRLKLGERMSIVLTLTTTDGLTLQTSPRPLPFLRLRVRVDSNNDTQLADEFTAVDGKDRDEAFVGHPFGFWTATDPSFAPASETLDGLTDWATIRIRHNINVPPGVDLSLEADGAIWFLARKVGAKQEMFSAGAAATVELAEIVSNAQASVAPGKIRIPSEWIKAGETELLVKFREPPAATPSKLRLYYSSSLAPTGVAVDAADVQVRPLTDWLTVYSVRRSAVLPVEDRFRPNYHAALLNPWTDLPNGPLAMTVLVHGFNVSEQDATTRFFPTYFKRLYWAGHPVMRLQTVKDALGTPRPAHTIGFSWPGDEGLLWLSGATIPHSQVLLFPEDEMHALQSGVPLSDFLMWANPNPGAGDRTVDVIAHSLGNLVVNSAITRDGMNHVIDRYVMNEAALPSEAFSDVNRQSSGSLFDHATALGYPDDDRWRQEWLAMPTFHPLDYQAWNNLMDVASATTPAFDPALFPKPQYDRRWTQTRTYPPPDVTSEPEPHRGSWANFFVESRSRVGQLHNTFSTGDQILTLAWYNCQLYQKPDVWVAAAPSFALMPVHLQAAGQLASHRDDSRTTRFWGQLWNGQAAEEQVWNSGSSHANITRQWGELAYWFPAVSSAAGATTVVGLTNHDFSQFSQGAGFVESHGYLTGREFTTVWGAFTQIRDLLKRP